MLMLKVCPTVGTGSRITLASGSQPGSNISNYWQVEVKQATAFTTLAEADCGSRRDRRVFW